MKRRRSTGATTPRSPRAGTEKVASLRRRVDLIDRKIATLLIQRFGYSMKIISEKRKAGLAVRDREREARLIAVLQKHFAASPAHFDLLGKTYRAILSSTVRHAGPAQDQSK